MFLRSLNKRRIDVKLIRGREMTLSSGFDFYFPTFTKNRKLMFLDTLSQKNSYRTNSKIVVKVRFINKILKCYSLFLSVYSEYPRSRMLENLKL